MPNIEVELADGTVLEFPEGTSDSVIDRVVKQHVQGGASAQAEAPPSKRWQDLTPEEAQARMAEVLPETGERVQNQVGPRPDAPLGQAFGHLVGATTAVIPGMYGSGATLAGQALRGAGTTAAVGAATDAGNAVLTGDPTKFADMVTKAPGRLATGAILGPALAQASQRLPLLRDLIEMNPNLARLMQAVIGKRPVEKAVGAATAAKAADALAAGGKTTRDAAREAVSKAVFDRLSKQGFSTTGVVDESDLVKLLSKYKWPNIPGPT